MSKRAGSAKDILAAVPSDLNGHLSNEQLLLALDGEVSSRASARTEEHLKTCWPCRVRSAKIGQAITDVVEYDCLFKTHSTISPGTRGMFLAQLDELSQSLSRPSLGVRLKALFRDLPVFSRSVIPRYAWVSSMAIALLMLFWLKSFREVPKVPEASEFFVTQLLEDAAAAEVRVVDSVAEPVIYQKVQIRAGKNNVTRTFYRDVNGNRHVDRFNGSRTSEKLSRNATTSSPSPKDTTSMVAERDLRQTFQDAGLDWGNPLSLASYRSWRDNLSQKQDEVTRDTSEFVTLRTRSVGSFVAAASITIRTADLHPVAGDFRLADMRYVEMDELDWRVISLKTIDSAIFGPESVESSVAPLSKFLVSTGPTESEVAESELQARITLHAEGADLGEEIEFDRNLTHYGQRSLLVRGILASPARKAELVAALHGIPNLELQLRTENEVPPQDNKDVRDESSRIDTVQPAELRPTDTTDSPKIQNLIEENIVTGEMLAEDILKEHFPDIERRTTFVNRLINLAQNALTQAWALRRLRDRYTPEEVSRLSPRSIRTLELLIHDHVLALRLSIDEVGQMISPVLPVDPSIPAAPYVNSGPPLSAAGSADDWRDKVSDIFPEVQKLDSSLVALFAHQPGAITSDQQGRIRILPSTLIQLESHLTSLLQQATGLFLSDPKKIDSKSTPSAPNQQPRIIQNAIGDLL